MVFFVVFILLTGSISVGAEGFSQSSKEIIKNVIELTERYPNTRTVFFVALCLYVILGGIGFNFNAVGRCIDG